MRTLKCTVCGAKRDQIARLLSADDMTQKEIADAVSVSRTVVQRIARELGLKLKTRNELLRCLS